MRHLFRPALFALAATAAAFLAPAAAFAAPNPSQAATVLVICGDRQGSGVLASTADGGYVVTVGHVPVDPKTHVLTPMCTVGFVNDDSLRAQVLYSAAVIHSTFEERADRDLAVLHLTGKISNAPFALPAPALTNEFAQPGEAMSVYGYPGGESLQQGAFGSISSYARGIMYGNAPISPGYSGGPAFDSLGRFVGIAERVRYEVDDKTGVETVTDYEYGDVLSLITWLDEFAPGEHDRVLMHADYARFHGAPYVSRVEGPGCAYVVRTKESPTVYCLLAGPQRLVFPNEATFFSWYPDTTVVKYISLQNITEYRLIGNVTMRAQSLVKVQTDPRVYVVTDSIGTMRGIPSEERATQLFGADWAKKVRDVPDTFFTDYRTALPLQ